MDLIKKAESLTPGDATIKEHLGDIYMKQSQKIKALRTYREALELIPQQNTELRENAELKKRLENKINEVYKLI